MFSNKNETEKDSVKVSLIPKPQHGQRMQSNIGTQEINNLKSILKKYWGYDDFRGIQREIIESIMSGHDTLGLMPTGGGKSITFQVPALALDGVCIIITPLIALMKDQVQNLRRRRIRAAAIYSGMTHDKVLTTLENAVFGQLKLLYISPERLSSELFLTKLRHTKVSFICVDEAHCISQWGYDFRPSYLSIAEVRKVLPNAPVLALTATATPEVVRDIQDKLTINHPASLDNTDNSSKFNVFRMSFERSNLAYIVRRATDKRDELIHILNNVQGSAIVYVRSRRRTKEISDYLNENLSPHNTEPVPHESDLKTQVSTYYHAGLDTPIRDERQTDWVEDRVRVMVATNAFGMGIDKPDVRLVIHIDCPDSIEAYFQEAGRAGRDGQKAYAVLLYNDHDERKLNKRIADTFPEKEYIKQVYDHLAYYYQVAVGAGYNRMFAFNVDDFCQKFHHFPIQVESALKILNRAGYIEYIEEQENQARVMFTLERDELYQLNSTTDNEERVITSLLRNYGGLFVDYVFIDESLIAVQTGLSIPLVYNTLKFLAQRHILKFIPQKRTPYIRYMQRREEAKHLLFPPPVYEELKQRYIQRITAMTTYAKTDNQCRSRQLLRYFGETSIHDCGQCDVCKEVPSANDSDGMLMEAMQQIQELLADHQPHHITEIRMINLPYPHIDAALQYLMQEEYVVQQDGFLCLED